MKLTTLLPLMFLALAILTGVMAQKSRSSEARRHYKDTCIISAIGAIVLFALDIMLF
ncbi:hypothetical protein SGADD02_02243 [Streptococcus gallolyticus]|uniref:Uncharacterized protein n=1 Tax=Streptococcus gallolyticus TaxID=315405 RepID=A0A139MH84_9STRE|nr:hypothetical protein [Streptococcus gallolyticus]KXT62931.1 hypothetical protein SGADD02_02243 [Streptococcus gallolyticus]MCO4503036.1 hypothetical protein [Streptococcus infantarius subsp. infantarius]